MKPPRKTMETNQNRHNIYISIITSINAIIINGTKDDILDMGELFHLLTNFREQRLMPC